MDNRAQTFWLNQLQQASNYNRWIFSQISPHLGQHVLEVGCGNGNFTELLRQGRQVVAIDLDAAYVEAARERLQGNDVKIYQLDATQLAAQSQWHGAFDSVVLLDVLEHIADDCDLLQQLRLALRPGGRLILKVPALEWLYSPMDKAIGHHRRYTPQRLKSVIQQADLSRSQVWYFNAAGIPGWWLNGSLLGRQTPPQSQVSWFDRCVPVLQALEERMPPPVGLSLFGVGVMG
ncbi:methyltransferase domain-containing protein [Romeria aff. gracilis LEGE 07310]|uniref:Methyltransferase domain-containing protein n=1 Tax=Vasconcelosia minhoensis LEGE 07310 TaxID=915328 RepID=A0A8J7AR18_9CYAN|nr:class I SAM-dependent methyltransferase [Romeria gracilis]MBE9078841.1 methyltransferase domain-containing protein [Romeria aff. gracilis LEGE 07310]